MEMSLRVNFLRGFLKIAFKLFSRLEVTGLENVPTSGSHILIANHLSYIDPPLLYNIMGGDHITGWAADKYRKHWLFGPIAGLVNPIFIRRGRVDRQALDAAVQALESGLSFGLAPEGTRSKTGALMKGKTGVSYLADQSGAALLVIAITGTEMAFKELLRLRRPRLTVRIAKPFHLPPLDPANRTASMRRNADEVMCRLAAMLPSAYRGEYADHPRLAEFLEHG
jgi:1-acyl-sn-glycerol-3-phosphate acyltransferase